MAAQQDDQPAADALSGRRAVFPTAFQNVDVLLLTAIVALYVGFSFRVITANARLGSFLVLTATAGLLAYWYASRYIPGARRTAALKYLALTVTLLATTLLPMAGEIASRRQSGEQARIHDGALQVEEGTRFFLEGKNPYTTDYDQTPLADWDFNYRGITTSPALYHYIYLPLSFMMTAPFLAFFEWAIGWFDIRFVYGAFWAVSLALCFAVTKEHTRRMILVITFGLSLLCAPFYVEGRNDVVIAAALLGIVYLLQKEKIVLAALVLGLACAFKQTMWFSLPFFFFYVGGEGSLRERLVRLRWPVLACAVPFFGLVLPWLLADPAAFIQDTYTYLSGTIPTSYPISGIGFAELTYLAGAVKSVSDYFPFTLYQAAVGLPVLAVGLWRQYRANTLRNALWHFALLLFAFAYFARTFTDSYLGFLIVVMGCAVLVDEPRQSLQPKEGPGMPDMGLLAFSLLIGQQAILTSWPTIVTLLLLLHTLAALLFLGRLSAERRWMLRFALIAVAAGPLLMGSILFAADASSLDAISEASRQILWLQNLYTAASADLTAWPTVLLLNAPLQWLLTALTGWYDFRLLVGALILVSGGLGLALFPDENRRVVLLAGLILSPALLFQVGGGSAAYLLLATVLLVIFLLQSGKYRAAVFVLAAGCSAHWALWPLVPYVMIYLWNRADRKQVAAIFLLGLVLWPGFFLVTDLSATLSHLFAGPGDGADLIYGLGGLLGMNGVWAGIGQGIAGAILVYLFVRGRGGALSLADVIVMAAFTGLAVMLVGHTVDAVVSGLLIIWGGVGLMLPRQDARYLEAGPA